MCNHHHLLALDPNLIIRLLHTITTLIMRALDLYVLQGMVVPGIAQGVSLFLRKLLLPSI
jgi:hypothetical protein